jgi:hypothetical protein
LCGRACASGILGRCSPPPACARTGWPCRVRWFLESRNGSTSGKPGNQLPKMLMPRALLSAKSAATQASEWPVSKSAGSGHTRIWGSSCHHASVSAGKIPEGRVQTCTLPNRPAFQPLGGMSVHAEEEQKQQRFARAPRGATAGAMPVLISSSPQPSAMADLCDTCQGTPRPDLSILQTMASCGAGHPHPCVAVLPGATPLSLKQLGVRGTTVLA